MLKQDHLLDLQIKQFTMFFRDWVIHLNLDEF